jgi:hypothetical protein
MQSTITKDGQEIPDTAKPTGQFEIKEMVREMIFYASPVLVNFPRAEKQLLARRIRETMYDMLHICNVVNKKYYKKDTINQLDVLLADLRDYLYLAASPKLYPNGTGAKAKKGKAPANAAAEQAAEPTPQHRGITCITPHQYEVWSRYTKAIGGMIGNYKKYVEGGTK